VPRVGVALYPVSDFQEFMQGEVRYSSLRRMFPEVAEKLYKQAEQEAKERMEKYKELAKV